MRKKDDYVLMLDYLPYGYPLEGKMIPVVQAIGEQYFSLLQIAPVRGATFEAHERIYIGPEKRDKVQYIIGRLPSDKLTEQARVNLQAFITKAVETREKEFVEFFNNAQAINTRLHQLELLPGFGKKHMKDLLAARQIEKFSSFDDIKRRVPTLPDPKKAIEKRLWEEITEPQRHTLFVY